MPGKCPVKKHVHYLQVDGNTGGDYDHCCLNIERKSVPVLTSGLKIIVQDVDASTPEGTTFHFRTQQMLARVLQIAYL